MLSGRKGSPSGVVDQIRVRNVFGGISVIGFKSCDQGREKFQGASLDFVWFDEEPPALSQSECRMRVLDRAGDIFGTMTPLKGMTFVYDEIYMNRRGDPEVWYEFMEWADNPYLDKREVKLMSGAMDDKALASRRYGRFAVGEGLVYPEFDERVHVIPPFALPADWQDVISIDPGLHNPLSAHWYCPRRLRRQRVPSSPSTTRRAETSITTPSTSAPFPPASAGTRTPRGDCARSSTPAANQRTLASAKSVAELFCERGILVDTAVDKDLFAGIAQVKSYLRGAQGPRLYIFDGCVNLIREIKGYFWGAGDVPKKRTTTRWTSCAIT